MTKKNIRGVFFTCLMLAMSHLSGWTQSGNNPFEILPRAEKKTQIDSNNISTSFSNPFDLIKEASGQTSATSITPKPTASKTEKKGQNSPPSVEEKYSRFLFVIMLLLLAALTLLFTIFRTIVGNVYRAFFNENLLNQLHREQPKYFVGLPYLILYIFFFFSVGLFVFLLAKHNGLEIKNSNTSSLLFFTGCIGAYYLFKHLVLRIIAYIFPLSKEVGAYSFTIMVFNIITGLLLIPFSIFLAYASSGLVSLLIHIAIGLVIASYAFRILRGFLIGSRFVMFHKFHFLLYICAVEIAPLLILLKLYLSKGGLQS